MMRYPTVYAQNPEHLHRYSSVWSKISSIPSSSLCDGRFTKSLPFPYVTHSLALNL